MWRTRWLVVGALAALVVLAFVAYVCLAGSVYIAPRDILRELLAGDTGSSPANTILWRLRLPRAVGCVLVGAILSAVGGSFQALFRNPLAEPYVIGVSSGASVGVTLAVLGGWSEALSGLGGMAAGFVAAVCALALVLALGARRGLLHIPSILLAGVLVGAALSALVTVLLLWHGEDANRILRALMGSMTPMFWSRTLVLLAALAVGSAALWSQTRKLNALTSGEPTAASLGVDVQRTKWLVLIIGTAMAAVTVGAVGIIAFVGLIAPHIVRRLVGPDLRIAMPGMLAAGGVLLLMADLLAQRLVPTVELPVGAVTAVIGAPLLVLLLSRRAAVTA